MKAKTCLALVLATAMCAMSVPVAAQPQILTSDYFGDDGDMDDWGSTDCNCYHDWDCGENQGCDIGTPVCLIQGKMDGLCREWSSSTDPPEEEPGDDVLNNAMERAFGYEFVIDPLQQFGNLRHVPEVKSARALSTATRAAFIGALGQRDPRAVRGPLEQFWRRHPDYRPRHSGRCYPHGHQHEKSPLDCQTYAFSRMVKGLLAT